MPLLRRDAVTAAGDGVLIRTTTTGKIQQEKLRKGDFFLSQRSRIAPFSPLLLFDLSVKVACIPGATSASLEATA
jgi:hypothetical protein